MSDVYAKRAAMQETPRADLGGAMTRPPSVRLSYQDMIDRVNEMSAAHDRAMTMLNQLRDELFAKLRSINDHNV